MVFPVVMYGCESWTIKKAEHRRNDAFELWCWRRLLRVPWTARRSNQSILREISPEYSVERLMLKLNTLATWCEELTPWERPWCWERLKVGGEGGDRGWDDWMASPTQWTWVWVSSGSWWWTGRPGELQFMGSQRAEYYWVTKLNWTESNKTGSADDERHLEFETWEEYPLKNKLLSKSFITLLGLKCLFIKQILLVYFSY